MSKVIRAITTPGKTRFITATVTCLALSIAIWFAFTAVMNKFEASSAPIDTSQMPVLENNPKIAAANVTLRQNSAEMVTTMSWCRTVFTLAPLFIALYELVAIVRWKRQQAESSAPHTQ